MPRDVAARQQATPASRCDAVPGRVISPLPEAEWMPGTLPASRRSAPAIHRLPRRLSSRVNYRGSESYRAQAPDANLLQQELTDMHDLLAALRRLYRQSSWSYFV